MRFPLLIASMLAAFSCKSTGNVSRGLSAASEELPVYPQISFEGRPSYIPNDVVVLTFDDAPDWTNTEIVLNVLRDKNVKASFFINGKGWSNLESDQPMRDLVKRMVNEGHELANHTMSHGHLGSMTPEKVESEISEVERIARDILGPDRQLTMLRAPFGEPFQNYESSRGHDAAAAYSVVAPIVAKHGVHVGWHLDSFDYNCAGNADCVFQNVSKLLPGPGKGEHGILLMHSVHPQTAAALPRIIDDLRAKGYKFWLTEDVIKAKYQKTSAQLMGQTIPTEPTKPMEPTKPTKPTEPKPPFVQKPAGCDAPAWESGRPYNVGDKVLYQGKVHVAEHANPGYDPIISYWYWEPVQTCQ